MELEVEFEWKGFSREEVGVRSGEGTVSIRESLVNCIV
jgi:hypothetical protein